MLSFPPSTMTKKAVRNIPLRATGLRAPDHREGLSLDDRRRPDVPGSVQASDKEGAVRKSDQVVLLSSTQESRRRKKR
jgi:hypothetical protein